MGIVLSHSSALPRPFYWLGLPSVHDLPAATLHTHSHASVCAYTSLPNASPPRARTPRLTVHPQLAAAKVASQTSASPFLPSPPWRGPAPSGQLLTVCSSRLPWKGSAIKTPTWDQPWFSPQHYTCLSSSPVPQEPHCVPCRQCYRYWRADTGGLGAGGFPQGQSMSGQGSMWQWPPG